MAIGFGAAMSRRGATGKHNVILSTSHGAKTLLQIAEVIPATGCASVRSLYICHLFLHQADVLQLGNSPTRFHSSQAH